MKIMFYSKILLFVVFLVLVCSHAKTSIDRVIIDNGYIHYLQASRKPRESVSLNILDISTGKNIRRYLPGCTCKHYRNSESSLFFPTAWTLNDSLAKFLFPLIGIDAMGRTVFYLWQNDVEDYFYPVVLQQNYVENEVYGETFSELDRVTWHGKALHFMNSAEFVSTKLNPNQFHLWYSLSDNEVLLHIPLFSVSYTSNGWEPMDNPSYFGWARYVLDDVPPEPKSISFFSVQSNDGATPILGVKTRGKKLYLEGEKRLLDGTSDWLVLFMQKSGTSFWKSLNFDNSWTNLDWENNKVPNLVIINNDSDYIFITNKLAINSEDIHNSLLVAVNKMRELNLLKDYPPREPSERMKKKLLEAEEKARIQAYILELRKQAEKERQKQTSEGALPAGGQPPGIPKFMTAEEAREILDGGAKSVFSDEELKELLAVPDPAKYKSSVELGLAYDWAGKFAEAKAELEKDTTPLGRFELGRFLMAGRPGISADRDRANAILEKLVNEMEDREDELTAAECLLAGKACHEIKPRKSTHWEHWTELGDEFFQQAIELGERAGYFYIQYYRRTSPDKKFEEMWKALPTDDIEARAGLAAYAGHVQQFKTHLNQEQHLHDLKTAILAHCNRAQYWLGLLYSLNVGILPGKYLKHNPDKARFWLKRAAERGDLDAQFSLGSLPFK